MGLKKFLSIFIVVLNFQAIFSQNEELKCRFFENDYGYNCELTIVNPNGFNNFTEISGDHIEGKTDYDVEVVHLSRSITTNIPSIICEKFKNIWRARYESSGIETIDDYSFSQCKNLTDLRITYTMVQKIHKNAFNENSALESLNLNANELSTLPNNVFANLGKKLTYLNLGRNNFKILKSEWFLPLVKLEELVLDNNEIEELPNNIFGSFKRLREFSMSYNKLKALSAVSFGDLSKLVSYSFYNNHLDAIDEKFVNSIKLSSDAFMNNWCPLIPNDKQFSAENLRECFDNYRALEAGCTLGDTNGRICQLENESQGLTGTVTTYIDKLQAEIDVLTIAVQSLQNQVNVLTTHS